MATADDFNVSEDAFRAVLDAYVALHAECVRLREAVTLIECELDMQRQPTA